MILSLKDSPDDYRISILYDNLRLNLALVNGRVPSQRGSLRVVRSVICRFDLHGNGAIGRNLRFNLQFQDSFLKGDTPVSIFVYCNEGNFLSLFYRSFDIIHGGNFW